MSQQRLIVPATFAEPQNIYLTTNRSLWIKIQQLPADLQQYARNNFDEMFDLHSLRKAPLLFMAKRLPLIIGSKVIWTRHLIIPSQRSRTCFLDLIAFQKLFSVPTQFDRFHQFVTSNVDKKYNQVVVS